MADVFPWHQRRAQRQPGIDYRTGMFFVTICIHQRHALLGEIIRDEMVPNTRGAIVQTCWDEIPHHHAGVTLDAAGLLPNHFHGILDLGQGHGTSLSSIVGLFKSASAKRINDLENARGRTVWQRGFYDHRIRDAADLTRIR
jgi:putative transposase